MHPVAGALTKTNMTREKIPTISMYPITWADITPPANGDDHVELSHASLNIVEHKSSEYVYNSDVAPCKARELCSRENYNDLEAIGVVSATRRPNSTFLVPAVAEYCVRR